MKSFHRWHSISGVARAMIKGSVERAFSYTLSLMFSMHITDATFVMSTPTYTLAPIADRPEYALIGRSNVGKSSLINTLCGKKALAKTSVHPGKTQLINYFSIESMDETEKTMSWYLVDLPGYGYAKVAKQQRNTRTTMIADYLTSRPNLRQVFVLIDSRHTPQAIDIQFIDQLGERQLPFCIVFTKSDQTTQKQLHTNVKAFMTELKKTWKTLPSHCITSAMKPATMRPLLEAIQILNQT